MAHTPAQRYRKIGLLGTICWKLIELIGWLLFFLLLACIIVMICFAIKGQLLTIQFVDNLSKIQLDLTSKLLKPVPFYFQLFNHLVMSIKVVTAWEVKLTFYLKKYLSSDNQLLQYFMPISVYALNYLKAVIFVTSLFVLRLAIIVAYMPLFIMLGFIGLIDGLVQRDIRRYTCQRESALVYHFAKGWISPSLKWSALIYLMMPIIVSPQYIMVPYAIVFGLALAVTTKRFKKYL